MAKPNKSTPRRSSRKKKHTRENTTTSDVDYDSDKGDSQSNALARKESILIPSRQSKKNAHSSAIGKVHKREKKLPSLAELEKMFDDSNDAGSDDYTTNVRINRKTKQLPLNKDQQPATAFQKQTPPKREQIEIVDNNAVGPSISNNSNTLHKIDLSSENNERSYLEQLEDEFSDNSNSSTKTIVYDYNTLQNKSNTFSPLPSTSRDNNTIMQNEILFNESQTIDTPLSSNSDTRAVKINNGNISATSVPHNPVKNSEETIIIDDEQPKKNMEIDNSIIIDVDNYKISKNITHNDGNTTTQTVNLTKSTQRPIIIKTAKSMDTNALKTVIYIRPGSACSPATAISLDKLIESMPCERNLAARNNDTNQTTNNTVGNNISNINNHNTPVESETIDIDTSSDEIEAELQSLQKKIRKYRKATKADSRAHYYRHIACPNLNLKVVSFNMKRQEWNTLKNILQVKKQSDDTTGTNNELAQQLQSTSEDHTDQSRTESNVNREIEQLTRRDSHEPINVGACPICIEPLKKDVASTLCGHLFCLRCIKSALQITGKKCPTCRKSLKGPGYHQIFI